MLRRTQTSVEAGQRLPRSGLAPGARPRPAGCAPAGESRVLLAAAALSHPTVPLVEEGAGMSRDAGLAPALEAGIVELDGDRIRFTHPLLAAGAYEAALPGRRAEVHARLAEAVDDPEARGGVCCFGHGTRRSRCGRAGGARRTRTCPGSSACRGAAPGSSRRAHSVRAGRRCRPPQPPMPPICRSSPATRRAPRRSSRASSGGLAPGPQRAQALVRLARVQVVRGTTRGSRALLAGDPGSRGRPEVLAAAHEGIATCFFGLRERLVEAVQHAETAADLALRIGADGLAAAFARNKLVAETLLGAESAATTASPCARRSRTRAGICESSRSRSSRSRCTVVDRAVEPAREDILEMLERASELGDESSRRGRSSSCSAGSSASAGTSKAHTRKRSRDNRRPTSPRRRRSTAYNRALEGLVEAHREQSRNRRAGRRSTGSSAYRRREAPGRARCSRSAGTPGAGARQPGRCRPLARAGRGLRPRRGDRRAVRDPLVLDAIEALVELARPDEALELLEWYEGNARRLGRAWALAACLRCRGLLAAQEGELDAAVAAYEEALSWHERVDVSARPRAHAARPRCGTTPVGSTGARPERRSKRRGPASRQMGAALWADRGQGRTPANQRSRGDSPAASRPAEERGRSARRRREDESRGRGGTLPLRANRRRAPRPMSSGSSAFAGAPSSASARTRQSGDAGSNRVIPPFRGRPPLPSLDAGGRRGHRGRKGGGT